MILDKRIFGVVAMMAFWLISGAFCATEEPVAVPTFHCIGLYWNPEEGGEDIACNVRYRLANSDEWKEAMPLWFDARGPEEHSRLVMEEMLCRRRDSLCTELRVALASCLPISHISYSDLVQIPQPGLW